MQCNSQIRSNDKKFVKLKQLDISKDLILQDLLSDVFEDMINDSDVKTSYYNLSFEKYDNRKGSLIEVTELLDSCLTNTATIGYIDYKGNIIYVINDGSYNISFSKPIKYYSSQFCNTDIIYVKEPLSWIYYIVPSIGYARHLFYFGWLWHIDKKMHEKLRNNKLIVSEPKRHKKD